VNLTATVLQTFSLPLFLFATLCTAQTIPGTAPLTRQDDIASSMIAGIDAYLMREWAEQKPSATTDRARFQKIIGLIDTRPRPLPPVLDARLDRPSLLAKTASFEVHAVRWAVLDGVEAEGLFLKPLRPATMSVVAIPDADQTPESLASGIGRRLAENGCQVLIPTIVDRKDTWSGNPRFRMTNQPHREFIYRMAFEMGRHIVGYEVQKVLAAVDYFEQAKLPIGVYGVGEGGLIALYSAASDTRIGRTMIAGYFHHGEQRTWEEPIYRNVWGLLPDFSDRNLLRLIAPRKAILVAGGYPNIAGPPAERDGRRGAAPGKLGAQAGGLDEDAALREFLGKVSAAGTETLSLTPRESEARMERQFRQLVDFTQKKARLSDGVRQQFAQGKDTATLRNYFWDEVIGRIDAPTDAMKVESRLIYDKPGFRGYEVVIPVAKEVFAYGILLLPKDLKPGERRPVVVTQHGLEGRPQMLVEPGTPRELEVYQRYAAQLAEQGFIVYAPQNPYLFGDRFRVLVRKGNPFKRSIYSFIAAQHQRTLEWLSSLPAVDPQRIGFYGLSYGGKVATRIPALLTNYALSICSGDFNEWIWKVTSVDLPFSYMFTGEYDMIEFDLGNTFNYSDMVDLIAPRPFMVERGHNDGVSNDELVSYEYAKVRRHYANLHLPGNTAIEYFLGPHQIHGVGTFEFLRQHLSWPK
jgi:dienelactone hydrolase